MNITAEKLQFASMIDAKVKSIGRPGGDDFTIFAEMADYLPAFRGCLRSFTSGRAV
jgi:hypothetical protein